MKKLLLFIFFALPALSHSIENYPEQKQWFVQFEILPSIETAKNLQKDIQNKIKTTYIRERDFVNFASIHPFETGYRVLMGPYPTKESAKSDQIANWHDDYPHSDIVQYHTNVYANYEHGYTFTWYEIDEKTYQQLLKKSVAILQPITFVESEIFEKKSLISHNDQIKEEIFDLQKAQSLLKQQNFILHQESPESLLITGYTFHEEYTETGWPFVFYAYYPSENLLVFQGEGGTLIGLSTFSGEFTLKLPDLTLYSPDKTLRISGENYDPLSYGRSYIDLYDPSKKQYVELIDLGAISPWFLQTEIHGLAWLSNNEVIFEMNEPFPRNEKTAIKTKYYRVKLDPIPMSGRQ